MLNDLCMILLCITIIILFGIDLHQTRSTKIAKFEKVSVIEYTLNRPRCDSSIEEYHSIKLPHRATTGSAGYDFYAPFDFQLKPGESIKIPTGIRAKINDGWVLQIFPRSSLGFKYRAQLDNTVGIIDNDYYFSDNEGHIFIKITNDSKNNAVINVKAGEAFAQGIFIRYGVTTDDNTKVIRNGGIGSTNK